MTTTTRKTKSTNVYDIYPACFVVTDQRFTGETDYYGEPVRELQVEGHGWCKYSWKLAAIWIGGAWRTNWNNAA